MSLSGLLPLLREVPEYTNLAGRMVQWRQQARAVVLPGLPLAARPYVMAALHRDVDASLLVIVPRAEDAKRLHEQITLWSIGRRRSCSIPSRTSCPMSACRRGT